MRDVELSAMAYYGGKARAEIRKWLIPLIPYEPNGLYFEPFAGMLGVLLARPKTKTEVINDLDNNIYNWWRVIRDKPDELMYRIHNTANCRQTYNQAFYDIKKRTYRKDPVKWAWCTWVVLSYNVAHGTGTGGWAVNFSGNGVRGKRNFADVVKPLAERLRLVQIECKDAMFLMDRVKDYDNLIMYCDPPYKTADTKSYEFDNSAVDYDMMTNILLETKGKVAVSGYRDEWDHLGWERHEWDNRAYPVSVEDAKKDIDWNRTEVLWTNYSVKSSQIELF